MLRKVKHSFLILLCGLFVACSTTGPHQPFTYRKTWSTNNPSQILTYRYTPITGQRNVDDSGSGKIYFKTAYQEACASGNGREVRNRILFELMGMVDDYYYRYTINLRSDVIGKNLLVNLSGIGTSFAASLVGGEQIKTVLSAISTGIQTFSTAIDKEVFMDNTVQALRFQMDANRAGIATQMFEKMGDGTAAYPLEAGLRDIIRYYDAGTLTSALSSLSAKAAKEKDENQKNAAKAASEISVGLSNSTPRL